MKEYSNNQKFSLYSAFCFVLIIIHAVLGIIFGPLLVYFGVNLEGTDTERMGHFIQQIGLFGIIFSLLIILSFLLYFVNKGVGKFLGKGLMVLIYLSGTVYSLNVISVIIPNFLNSIIDNLFILFDPYYTLLIFFPISGTYILLWLLLSYRTNTIKENYH